LNRNNYIRRKCILNIAAESADAAGDDDDDSGGGITGTLVYHRLIHTTTYR